MVNETDATYIIDAKHPPVSASKDGIRVYYRPQDASKHFAAAHGPVYCYAALNTRNNHVYTVTFFLSVNRGLVLATCNCPARKVCKHIARTWDFHAGVVEAGILPAFELVDNPVDNEGRVH